MNVTSDRARRVAEKLRNRVQKEHPEVGVDVLDSGSPGDDAFLQIAGDDEATHAAALDASNLAAEIWEKEDINISIHVSKEIWCRKSKGLPLDMKRLPGEPSAKVVLVAKDKRGILFVCSSPDDHTDHDWGNVKPRN